jgi:hypothetical protein
MMGSIIIMVATDAPLLPHQLERLAKRTSLGVGRLGGLGEDSSGDIFLAFSTANPRAAADTGIAPIGMLTNDRINPIFEATVQATEEAIINAMLGAETMTGADSVRSYALPHDRLRAVLRKYNRLAGSQAPCRPRTSEVAPAARGSADHFRAHRDPARGRSPGVGGGARVARVGPAGALAASGATSVQPGRPCHAGCRSWPALLRSRRSRHHRSHSSS